MAYISSKDNRFYVALEASFGQAPGSAAFHQIPAVKLITRQQHERADRKDKTGSRTFVGRPSGGRRTTTFDLTTYSRNWADQTQEPSYGPLFEACLGGAAIITNPLAISSAPAPSQIAFGSEHGLVPGQGLAYGGELRFITAVVDQHTIQVNSPFSTSPAPGTVTGATATYSPKSELSSFSLLDCWSPSSAVQRFVYGAAADQLQIQINGDYHAFQFSGPACDIVDNASFQEGQGGLSAFPMEPASTGLDYSIIPGHLGQAWLGSSPTEFFTLTAATVTFKNNLSLRTEEFGSNYARGISPGLRSVTIDFSLFQPDDSQSKALYQAARQESPVSIMLQLGQQAGQLTGIYMKSVMLETPEFNDSETRQQWVFKNCRAQGIADDELSVAFA